MSACTGCGATIEWRVNDRTGSKAPINVDPDPEGNVTLVDGGKFHVLTKAEKAALDNPGMFDPEPPPRYTSHFSTCPEADTFKRRCKRCRQTKCECAS